MIRTQLQLDEQQASRLRTAAAAEGRSVADLVREAISELLLRRRGSLSRADLARRALTVAGRYRSGLPDLAERHDEHFADAVTDWPSTSTPRR